MAVPNLTLAARMKAHEATYDTTLPTGSPTILRLDGHAFSKLTSHFSRPFDQRIHSTMINTSSDLLNHFPSATLAYTQSDEITLVFPSGIGSFNDRIQKISSLAAAYCTASFNLHLSAAMVKMPEPRIKEGVLGTAYFDARVLVVPSVEEALTCVIWRFRGDALRNSVGSFARTMYSTKELHLKNNHQILDIMRVEKGVVFEEAVPKWAVEGSMVKKEKFLHEGKSLKTGELETTERTRLKVLDRGIRCFSDENLKLITERFWSHCRRLECMSC